jgi:SAM-dependent methyltransferase
MSSPFPDHFSSIASSYARHRPRYPAALVEFLANITPARELAWDCGCGSGQLSVGLASRFDRVIATDASAEQLAKATPHRQVEYRCATAEKSGLPDRVVDAAIAAQAAHWFDLPAWHREVRRVSKPGAIVAAITYGNVVMEGEVGAIVGRFYREVTEPYWSPERKLVDEGYRSMPFPFEEIEAPALEMSASWNLADFTGYVRTWSGVQGLEKAEGRAPIETFEADLGRAWGPADARRPVRWPLSMRVGRL